MARILRGDVVWAELDPTKGSERVFMKRVKTTSEELRVEYKRSDFKKLVPREIGMRDIESKMAPNIASRSPDQPLPFLMRPDLADLSLAHWAKGNLSVIDANLLQYGAILFQAVGVTTQEDFGQLIETLFPETLSYVERSTPRTRLTDRLYTSTEYPASESIALHNESSYASVWPGKVCFFCLSPADRDGETPLADVRKIYERIDHEIVDAFDRKGWMLVRNYHEGMGLAWQSAFQTDDKRVVEEYCRSGQIEFEWIGGDRLRTRQVRPAMARHSKTGEMVWFNHIAFWHITGLDDETREVMTSLYAAEDLPYNTYYGDGFEIESDVIDHIREAYEKEKVVFPWRQGDVLLLDNMLVAHGRNPFKGPRKILVAMAEPQTNRNL